MGNEEKCQVCEFKVAKLQEEFSELKDKLQKVEEKQATLENNNVKIDLTLKNFEEKFSKIEYSLDSIVTELKGIGDKLLMLKVKEELTDEQEYRKWGKHQAEKDDAELGIIGKMAGMNSKTLWFVILFMGVALLFSMGMKADDILKLLGK